MSYIGRLCALYAYTVHNVHFTQRCTRVYLFLWQIELNTFVVHCIVFSLFSSSTDSNDESSAVSLEFKINEQKRTQDYDAEATEGDNLSILCYGNKLLTTNDLVLMGNGEIFNFTGEQNSWTFQGKFDI